MAVGKPGVVEVISTLPRSYPGHVLLTEDRGVVHGVDDGHWPGKRFSILGRLFKEFGVKVTFRQLLNDLSNLHALTKHVESNLPAEAFAGPDKAEVCQEASAPAAIGRVSDIPR